MSLLNCIKKLNQPAQSLPQNVKNHPYVVRHVSVLRYQSAICPQIWRLLKMAPVPNIGAAVRVGLMPSCLTDSATYEAESSPQTRACTSSAIQLEWFSLKCGRWPEGQREHPGCCVTLLEGVLRRKCWGHHIKIKEHKSLSGRALMQMLCCLLTSGYTIHQTFVFLSLELFVNTMTNGLFVTAQKESGAVHLSYR